MYRALVNLKLIPLNGTVLTEHQETTHSGHQTWNV